jgi:CHAT domain-containing protein/Tfp pilus assembly protein PilF
MLWRNENSCRNRRSRIFSGLICLAGLALFLRLATAAAGQAQRTGEEMTPTRASSTDPASPSKAGGPNALDKAELKKLVAAADRFKREGKYPEALRAYLQALAILSKIVRTHGEAIVLRRIAAIYRELNKPDSALEWYRRSLEAYRALGKPDGEATVRTDMGIVYRILGNYAAALDALAEALRIRRSLNDLKGTARVLINMGVIYFDQSRYARAIGSYEEAISILSKIDDRDPAVYARALNNLALNYTELGQYPKALELYRRALPLIEQTGDIKAVGTMLHNIGFAYAKAENPSEALHYYERALSARESIPDENGMASTLNNMGFLLSKQGEVDEALNLFEDARALARKNNAADIEGRILDSEGDSYAQAGQFTAALAAYHEALAIRKWLGNRRGERVTLANIGRVLQKQGRDSVAIVFYKQAVNVSESIRRDLADLPDEVKTTYTEKVSETYRSLADLLLKYDRVVEAQQVLDLLKLQELEDYLQDVRGSAETRQGVEQFHGEKRIADQDNEIIARLAETLRKISELEGSEDSLTESEREDLKKLISAKKQFAAAFNHFLDSEAVLDWEDKMTRTERRSTLELDHLFDLQDNLKKLKKTVLLYPLILDDRLEIVLVTPFAPPVHQAADITRIELNDLINNFRRSLTNVGSDPRPPARKLYDKIIDPVHATLESVGAETIIYAPDGALRYVPLSALYDGQKWLIERYKIHRITSYSLSDLNIEPSGNLRVLAGAFSAGEIEFAVGEQNFHFSGLPFARIEIEDLAQIIPNSKTLFNKDFTPQNTEAEAGLYTVVHLATHASFLTGQPDESFILFGNGERLTLMDVKQRWSGAVLPNVELIVLSACETGIGGRLEKGDEILGFGYLMERAGADASIATLWTVDDGGTQILMDNFYRKLSHGKTTKAQALQQAQLTLLQGGDARSGGDRGAMPADSVGQLKGRLSHPYYWAPFILIGNGL